ncbi:E3 ubiquitin-protein ligase BOI-like [Andrographis paniculata]|uniref:E3 ubiquitin-protein ligase BOI-like n=1 Tax=Andrographis paniculata TaxID=175694 RepID=UPI0021E89B29|nr:E3 ubiquitin-protein ligase BOI-like [Andrographis paniculata]
MSSGSFFLPDIDGACWFVATDEELLTNHLQQFPVDISPHNSLFPQLQRQREDLDAFIQFECNKWTSAVLQESRLQQEMMKQKYESVIRSLKQQEEEEMAMARNRLKELQEAVTAAEMKARYWEHMAWEERAIFADLSRKMISSRGKEQEEEEVDDDDALSFCGSSSFSASSSAAAAGKGNGKERKWKIVGCKLCQARRVCVVFLPCTHLCCCKICESFLGHCPICFTVKETTLDVSLH